MASLLDFGSGNGEFCEALLGSSPDLIPTEKLLVVEPETTSMAQAVRRLSNFGVKVEYASSLPPDASIFDMLISNHVFYYVHDLAQSLRNLIRHMNENSILVVSMGSNQNELFQFWEDQFKMMNREVPFFLAADLESALWSNNLDFFVRKARSELDFVDTRENRQKIGRVSRRND